MNVNGEMTHRLGIMLAAIFAALSLLHLYWAAGGRWASSVSIPIIPGPAIAGLGLGGERAFNPSAFTTVLVAAALLLAMLTILGQLGFWGAAIPQWFFRWGTCGIAVVFLLRAVGEFRLVGFFKQVRATQFAHWDTWLFSPLCLAIAVIAFLLTYHRRH